MLMKKSLALAGSLAALLLPAFALAAYNDVSLDTGVVLSVSGATLTITGSAATIESIVVGSGEITFTLPLNASIDIADSGGHALLNNTGGEYIVTNTCSSGTSELKFSNTTTGSPTITVSPSSDSCSGNANSYTVTSSSSSGGSNGAPVSSGGGGRGGGGSTGSNPVATVASTPATNNTPITGADASLTGQLQSQLAALKAQLAGTVSFKRDLQVGASGADVKALQVYLNTHGYVVAKSGAGSPGNETTKFGGATKAALIKLQKAVGLKPPAGYFGAKTRAYVASHQ